MVPWSPTVSASGMVSDPTPAPNSSTVFPLMSVKRLSMSLLAFLGRVNPSNSLFSGASELTVLLSMSGL